MNEDGFIGFQCTSCHTEIEASLDMIGQTTECPACGAKIVVPAAPHDDNIVRHAAGDDSTSRSAALKSRTIRIELADL